MTTDAGRSLAEHTDVAGALEMLSAWIEAQVAHSRLPGLSAGIVAGQDLIWSQGFACADSASGTAASASTIYRIASISKSFTGTAVMLLRDAGALKLDDPLVEHLPWYELKSDFRDAPVVTLRHLLTHTAGLPREAAFPYWMDFQFPNRSQLITTLPEQSATYAPEPRMKYSNLAVALAGEVVSTVSGQAYDAFVNEHILSPLNMTSTSVSLPDEHRERLATGYSRLLPGAEREVAPFTDAGAITPAANFASTVEDLAKFISLQFRDGPVGGNQILKGSTLREMHRAHWVFPDWSGGRGLGFAIRRHGYRTLVGHGGHVAGYRTQIVFDPAERLGAVVLINASDGNTVRYTDWIFQHVVPAIAAATSTSSEQGAFDPAWERFIGKYRNRWAETQVLRRGDELVIIDPTDENPTGSMYRLQPLGEAEFRMEGEDGSGPVGERARFELDSDGRVERLWMGAGYTVPIGDWSDGTVP